MMQQSRNWLSSPIGTELLLSLIGNGRKTNNYLQMNKNLKDLKGYYSNSKIFLSHEHKLVKSHDIDTEKTDFKNVEAKENINKWIKENGVKKWDIKKYISSRTKYVLLNITNLQMPWYASKGCGPLMTVYNTFSYTEDVKYEARILELPLQNRDFKVIVLVPNEVDVLYNLFNKMAKECFNAATNSIQPLFTAVSELNAPKIEFQAINQFSLEQSSQDILTRSSISIGDVNINDEGAFVNCLTCILSDKSNVQDLSTLTNKANVGDSSAIKPFLFTINYRNNPIFTGQYVCPV